MFNFTIINVLRGDEILFAIFLRPEEMADPQTMSQLSHVLVGSHSKSSKLLYPTFEGTSMFGQGAKHRLYICFANLPSKLKDWTYELQKFLPPQYLLAGGDMYVKLKLNPPQEGSFEGVCIGVSVSPALES